MFVFTNSDNLGQIYTPMMIQVQLHTRHQYFEHDVLEEMYRFIREDCYANRATLPMSGLHYRCFHNIIIKEWGSRSVYMEYFFEFLEKKENPPSTIHLSIFDIKIYDDLSEGIQELIDEVNRKQKLMARVN